MKNGKTLIDGKIIRRMHEICDDQWLKEKTARFIVVIHGWHVTSNGFNVYEIDADNIEEAEKISEELRLKRESSFDACAAKIIPVFPEETIVKTQGRKLTWGERLIGRIKNG